MEWLGVALAVLGLAALSGAAFARFMGAKGTEALEIWKAEAEAQKVRGDRFEAEITSLVQRVERLEVENRRLAELASGQRAIEQLTDLVVGQHAEVIEKLKAGCPLVARASDLGVD